MMKKGQVSFDIILALTMILMLAQILTNLSEDILSNQHKITIKSQQKQIALNLEKAINYNKILDRGADSSFEYEIPLIYVSGYKEPVGCTIDIADDSITVTVDSTYYPALAAGEEIKTIISTANNAGTDSFNCGDSVVFTNSPT